MDAPLSRRLVWHGGAGLLVGFAATFGTACMEPTSEVAFALFICTPFVATCVGLLAGLAPVGVGAVWVAAAASIAGGMVNAVLTYALSQMLAGRAPSTDLALVIVFSVPWGGSAGAAYALPMALGSAAARFGANQLPGSRGAARPLVALVAVVGAAGAVLARTTGPDSAIHALVRGGSAVLALACVVQAAFDLDLARMILRARSPERGLCLVPETKLWAPSAIEVVAGNPGFDRRWVVARIEHAGTGPYREGACLRPVMALPGEPSRIARSRLCTAVLFYGLAIGLALLAAVPW